MDRDTTAAYIERVRTAREAWDARTAGYYLKNNRTQVVVNGPFPTHEQAAGESQRMRQSLPPLLHADLIDSR